MLSFLKYNHVNSLMALGFTKGAAKALSKKLDKAYKKCGANGVDIRRSRTAFEQSIVKGYVDEMDLRVMAECCPPLVQAMMDKFGYTHRNLTRHVIKKKVTGVMMVEAVMEKVK